MKADATASGNTTAAAEANAQLEARDVKITALGADYATTSVSGTGLALIAAQAAKATTTVDPNVTASLGEGAVAMAHRNAVMSSESRAEGDAFAVDTGGLGTVDWVLMSA
jgi:hypothetical protein